MGRDQMECDQVWSDGVRSKWSTILCDSAGVGTVGDHLVHEPIPCMRLTPTVDLRTRSSQYAMPNILFDGSLILCLETYNNCVQFI
jgi:hypothetical protein